MLQDQLKRAGDKPSDSKVTKIVKDYFKQFANTQKFISKYSAFVCLWISRICSILIAYQYYGYPGFVVLTWVIASFIVQLYWLAKITTNIYLPCFALISFYEYAVNIQKINPNAFIHEYDESGNVINWSFGIDLLMPGRTEPIWPTEVTIMITNIICMIILIRSNDTLKELRNNFKDGIFEKLTNPKNNFLW
jgi:hypothetical protein